MPLRRPEILFGGLTTARKLTESHLLRRRLWFAFRQENNQYPALRYRFRRFQQFHFAVAVYALKGC